MTSPGKLPPTVYFRMQTPAAGFGILLNPTRGSVGSNYFLTNRYYFLKYRGSADARAPFAGAGEFTGLRGSGSFLETNRPAQQIRSEDLIVQIEPENFCRISN